MLSSDKPVASTWLDRLRLSKGLSTSEDDDASGTPLSLDDFLRRNHSASDSPPSAPTPSDPELTDSPSDPNPGEWYGVMSDVLSELFNYSGSSRSTTTVPVKKLPRKQSNPKHCSVETPPPPQRPKFATEKRETRRRRVVEEEDDGVEEEEEEEGEKDLVGFSRSEVTVIDTSFKIWKAEKVVFRRRSVWKVRDKKGNSRGAVSSKKKKTIKMKIKKKKKRKCDVDGGEIGRKSKKMKLSRSVSDNSPHYSSEDLRDDPQSSNANRTLLRRQSPHYSSEDLRDDPQSSNANRTLLHCHLNQEAYYILARRTANLRLVAIGLWPDRATKLNLCLYVYDDSVV
ncbi:hypothetical protein F2Q68_00012344 [Brassica cretica]|uniref:Uncharacterized protein n=1 Tax=Brassica cretica TaxID=69181 RepID=A0A8S9KPR6_BRACR|nr:hypothetical protein F2Q68_00012344 [Brassica cretica]